MSGMIPLARRLAAAIEPVAGQAQFSPECHANYEALGFAPSPGMVGRTALPDKGGFFTSRGAVLGDVPAEVVAAVFAVFNPDEIVPIVRQGKTLANASTMWAARLDGAAAQLRRILGPKPARAGWATTVRIGQTSLIGAKASHKPEPFSRQTKRSCHDRGGWLTS